MLHLCRAIVMMCWWFVKAESWACRNPTHHYWNSRSSGSGSSRTSCSVAPTTLSSLEEQQQSQQDNAVTILADDHEFIKPERDARQYRLIQLPKNHLTVLLISDDLRSGVGVEGASVHVKAGHFDDTIPGLAHFHEHMLFLGTQKYPDEDEYEAYLNRHGGYSNAYTDMEDTNYYFSVTTNASECFDNNNSAPTTTTRALAGALDRLSQFFIAPTFDRDAVDRELKAIDSEYRNGKTSDAWRSFSVLKSVAAHPNHPFAKFGCGNYATLSQYGMEKLLQELQLFWEQYYQPYNIRLAVSGHGSLDALQETVLETFGKIPSRHDVAPPPQRHISTHPHQFFTREHAVYNNGIPAFGPTQLGVYRRVIPFLETRKLKLSFATPPTSDPRFRHSKPYRALSHFLGHEAPGSLHALLNDQGYITSLTSGISLDTSDFSVFCLTFSLTPQGMAEADTVLDLAFQWIALLKQQSQEQLKAYHNELRQLSMNGFRFRENSDPTEFCGAAAEFMFTEALDPSKLLLFSNEDGDYDSETAKAFLERLHPSNCFVTVVSSDFVADSESWKEEKWYGAKYQEERFTPETVQRWQDPVPIDPRLCAPGSNKYIPTDFSLRCDAVAPVTTEEDSFKAFPQLLRNDQKLRLWHKLDTHWRVPKALIKTAFLSPSMYQTPRSMTLNRIFQRVLNDDLNSFVYDASIAGCGYKLTSAPTGFRLSVHGYSEKLTFLLDTLTLRIFSLIEEMKQGDPSLRLKFEKGKEALLRETKNYRLDAPYEINSYNSRLLLEEKVWYLDNYVDVMEGEAAKEYPLTMEECAEAALKSLTHSKLEVLCMGNINESETTKVANTLESRFLKAQPPLADAELPTFRSMMLPTANEAAHIFGPDTSKTIPIVYQELSGSETEENNAVELFFQVDSELEAGYRGIVLLDLVAHMASTSAFATLRTNEQLGYIVSAHGRKTAGGGWGLSVVVQSSVAQPEHLEDRIEAWLATYRQELNEMTPADMASEASAVVAQYLEKETRLSQEVNRVWGDVLGVEGMVDSRLRRPSFQRVDLLASALQELIEDPGVLKSFVLALFDKHLSAHSPQRRVLSSRIYRHDSKDVFEEARKKPGVLTSHEDIRYLKHFLKTMPDAPYWRLG